MITVVLPVLDQPELTANVLARLAGEPPQRVRVVMCDNGSDRPTREVLERAAGPGRILVDTRGLGLYAMWRFGWRTAAAAAHDAGAREWEVAFLNTDVDFLPGTITQMREALRAHKLGACCPDYERRVIEGRDVQEVRPTRGSYRDGGLAGWCFMLRGELADQGLDIDVEYEWWCGDDDVFAQVERLGWELGIIGGLPLDHVGEATARHHDWTEKAKGRDILRFERKWGLQ